MITSCMVERDIRHQYLHHACLSGTHQRIFDTNDYITHVRTEYSTRILTSEYSTQIITSRMFARSIRRGYLRHACLGGAHRRRFDTNTYIMHVRAGYPTRIFTSGMSEHSPSANIRQESLHHACSHGVFDTNTYIMHV
jgi:hypothetical protein